MDIVKTTFLRSELKQAEYLLLCPSWHHGYPMPDEYFVKPDIYANVFEPFGIPSREVLHHKTGEPLTSVLQLIITETSQSLLGMDNQPFESCLKCGRKKFLPFTKGPFSAFKGNSNI